MERSIEKIRSDFPFLETNIIYLDNGATALTPEPAIEAMLEYFHEYNANIGRGLHQSTKKASEKFENSREKVSKTINAKPKEIAFTKNTTEALNLLARGLDLEKGDKVIATILEHHSNLIPWQRLEKEKGIELEIVHENNDMIIEPSAIESAIDEKTKLITMPHVSNAFGTRQPVKEVGKIAEENNVLFSLDAAQSVGYQPIDVSEINCDFLAAPGHKGLLGPQGTGILYITEEHLEKISPLLYGGGIVKSVREHEVGLEEPPQIFDAGTPNIPGVIALGESAEYVTNIGLEKIKQREHELVEAMLRLDEEERVTIYGPKSPEKLGGLVSFNIQDLDSHEVSSILDETKNIATRSGYHCAEPAMNFLNIDGNVRVSVHFYNTLEEIDTLLNTVSKIVEDLI